MKFTVYKINVHMYTITSIEIRKNEYTDRMNSIGTELRRNSESEDFRVNCNKHTWERKSPSSHVEFNVVVYTYSIILCAVPMYIRTHVRICTRTIQILYIHTSKLMDMVLYICNVCMYYACTYTVYVHGIMSENS